MQKTQTYQVEVGTAKVTIIRQKFIDPQVVVTIPIQQGGSSLAAFNWAMHLIFEEVARDTECRYEFVQVVQVAPEISRVLFKSVPEVVVFSPSNPGLPQSTTRQRRRRQR